MILLPTSEIVSLIENHMNSNNFDNSDRYEITSTVERSRDITLDLSHISDTKLILFKDFVLNKIKEEESKDKIEIIEITREYYHPSYVRAENDEIIKAVIQRHYELEIEENGELSSDFSIKTSTHYLQPNRLQDLENYEGEGLIETLEEARIISA